MEIKKIPLKGYENYLFCPRKCEIFSERNGVLTPILPVKKYRKDKTYVLYKNGVYEIVRFAKILIDNWQEIEQTLSDHFKKSIHLS